MLIESVPAEITVQSAEPTKTQMNGDVSDPDHDSDPGQMSPGADTRYEPITIGAQVCSSY